MKLVIAVRLMIRRLAALTRVEKVGLLLLATAVLVALVGYLNQRGSLYMGEWVGAFLQDYYANISTELASIAITVLIVDALYQQRDVEREKRDLILQMGSPDNTFAVEAVRRLRAQEWLEYGALRGAFLEKANLTGVHLHDADLEGAHLAYANLSGAILVRANLSRAHLGGANLRGADLHRANLRGADLRSINLSEAKLRAANLSGADLQVAHLSAADLSGAKLSEANLRWADLNGAIVTAEQLAQARSLEGATMPDGTKHD